LQENANTEILDFSTSSKKAFLRSKSFLIGGGSLLLAAIVASSLIATGVLSFGDSHPKANYLALTQPILDEDEAINNSIVDASNLGVDQFKLAVNEALKDIKALREKVQTINPGTPELTEAHQSLITYLRLRVEAVNVTYRAISFIGTSYQDSYFQQITDVRDSANAELANHQYLLAQIEDPK
jgi:hypothetical protein